jgi:hypothetical protein
MTPGITVPVLTRKPGALRNGAPFKDWPLPASLERVRRKLKGSDDGDRQMVKILSAVLSDGLVAVEAACTEALAGGVHSADVILNILARQRDPGPAATILTPDALRMRKKAGSAPMPALRIRLVTAPIPLLPIGLPRNPFDTGGPQLTRQLSMLQTRSCAPSANGRGNDSFGGYGRSRSVEAHGANLTLGAHA